MYVDMPKDLQMS